jgi:hypothetical protein
MGELATVSDLALIGFFSAFRYLAQCGTRPQLSRSRRRWPVSGFSRITGADWLGAIFQEGWKFGTGFMV